MFLLGYERGEAAATFPVMFRAELDRLMALARERGRTEDPLDPPAAGVVPHARSRSCATSACKTLTGFLQGGHPGPGLGDLQAVLERVPPGRHRARGRHPRRRRDGADGRWPVSSFQADSPGAPNDSASVGRRRSSTRGPARSTRARRRCSATSSARWCSACPRSPDRPRQSSWREGPEGGQRGDSARVDLVAIAPVGRLGGVGARRSVRGGPRCGRRRCAQLFRLAAPGWWRRPPFVPLPDPAYLALPPGDRLRRRPGPRPGRT